MNFAVPAALWGLPLVAVPIIIHLLQRRRTQKVEFAAMRFLAEALRRTRRRVLLEDLLLLLLRTLAVLALILALARPSTESLPLALGREARAEILLLDASLSMDHRQAGSSSFERARDLAAERLDALQGQLDDRAALLRSGLSTERLASGDPREVQKALSDLAPPHGGSADLAAGLLAARQTAIDMGLPLESVRITLLTDLQASQWPPDAPVRGALARLADLGSSIEVIDCGADLRDNLAVTGLELSPSQVVAGDTVEATFRVRNYASSPADIEVVIKLDQEVLETRSLLLGPLEEQTQSVLLHPVALGPRVVEILIPHDKLVGDDQRAAVLEVRESLQVLLVGELALDPAHPGLVETIGRYLSLGPEAPIQASPLPLPQLTANALEQIDVLLLADPGDLAQSQAKDIADWVAAGGGLLFLPGANTGQNQAASLFTALAAEGLEIGEIARPGAESAARLAITDAAMPALRFFADPRWQPLLTEVPFLVYRPLWIDPAQAAGLHVGLNFLSEGAEKAGLALVDGSHGRGHFAVLAAAPMPGWNRMEEVPGGTLPLLFDLLFTLSPPASHSPQVEFGAPLTLDLPFPATDITLRDPEGLRRNLAQGILGSSRARLTLSDRANRAGVWDVDLQLLHPDGSEESRREHFAVVNPEAESDLRVLNRRLLVEGLPANISILRPQDATTERPNQAKGMRQLATLLLFLMMAFLVGETLLAATLDRRRMGA